MFQANPISVGAMKVVDKCGFTLIELLITITIIGILAATILASLNDARLSGINARIQAEMDGIAKRADIDHIKTDTYNTVCGTNGFSTSTDIADLIQSINSLASSTVTCHSSVGSYAVSVPLGAGHWCVDSAGAKKEVPAALAAGEFVCP